MNAAAKRRKQVAVGVSPWNNAIIQSQKAAKWRQQTMGQFHGHIHKALLPRRIHTKYRRKTITGELQERMYQYIGGIIRNLDGSLVEIGGIEDHVHLLVNLPASRSVSTCIRDIKANASKWMNELQELSTRFEWQKGYGGFTVSHSQIEVVLRYIQNQREHHRIRSFEEEFMELLRRHEIEFDRKYLFEAEHVG